GQGGAADDAARSGGGADPAAGGAAAAFGLLTLLVLRLQGEIGGALQAGRQAAVLRLEGTLVLHAGPPGGASPRPPPAGRVAGGVRRAQRPHGRMRWRRPGPRPPIVL